MNRRRLLRGTAYHEAGHAVTALALGLQCPRISIALEPDGTGLFGRAMVTPPAGPPPRNYDCVALAGDVAGQMAGDQNGSRSHIVEVGDRIGLGELYRLQTLTHRYLRLVWPKVEAMAEALWAAPDGVLVLSPRPTMHHYPADRATRAERPRQSLDERLSDAYREVDRIMLLPPHERPPIEWPAWWTAEPTERPDQSEWPF